MNLFRGRQGSGEATFVATTNRPSRRCATATLVELLQQQKSASACYFFVREEWGVAVWAFWKRSCKPQGEKKNPRVSIWILFLVPISNGNVVVTEEFAEKWKYSDGGSLTGQHRWVVRGSDRGASWYCKNNTNRYSKNVNADIMLITRVW